MQQSRYNRRQWMKAGMGLARGSAIPFSIQAEEKTYHQQVHPGTGRWMMEEAPGIIKARLTSNENPYGPSDRAKMAIIHGFKDANLYSRTVAVELKNKIASYEGVKPEQVFLCAGLSEVLNLVGAVTGLEHGDLVSAHPTFDLMLTTATAIGGKWIKVPLNKQYQHDLPAMEAALTPKTKLLYICNPGNPCSTIVDPEELSRFCERVSRKNLVFVDEAYNDYIPDAEKHSMVKRLKAGDNVMIGKTLSKVHGFAGLRVAYVMASKEFIKELEKYRTWDFSMNAPSMHGALATLDDEMFKKYCIQKNAEVRDMTVAGLQKLGYDPLPSYTNFLIFPIKKEGKEFVQMMQAKEVGLRSWSFDNKQWCRVSIGSQEEMQLFLHALKEVS